MSLRIGDLIEVLPVQTVIKLGQGVRDVSSIATSFVFTYDVAAHFHILSEAFQKDAGRGFFLQGDYGVGKSHWLNAVSAWIGEYPGSDALDRNPDVRGFRDRGRKLLPVEISLLNYRSTTRLEQIVVSEIEAALVSRGMDVSLTPLGNFLLSLKDLLREAKFRERFAVAESIGPDTVDEWIEADPRRAYVAGLRFFEGQGLSRPEMLVEDRRETFERAMDACRKSGYHGMVLLLDEVSEWFRSKGSYENRNEDARTLQFLGEFGDRAPVFVIAAIQEGIERTGDIEQATFKKIKARFPVRLNLSKVHVRDLLQRRLVKHKKNAEKEIRGIYDSYVEHFPGFKPSFDEFAQYYPLHPETLSLLEGLGDLLSQHRGIVDFVHSRVGGDPGRKIEGILDRPCNELLGPDAIYDHFENEIREYSAFHRFPREIIPHLDNVILDLFSDEEEIRKARRLVRMLAVYKISPVLDEPPVHILAELVSSMVTEYDHGLNVEYVAEGLLDPIVEAGKFLAKKEGTKDGSRGRVYCITLEDDPEKNLKARIRRVFQEVARDDRRVFLDVLQDLEASESWIGPEILADPLERTLLWRNTERRILAAFATGADKGDLRSRIEQGIERGSADCALVLVYGDDAFEAEHAAVWRIPSLEQGRDKEVLCEFMAAKAVLSELKPSSPADSRLIPAAKELLERLRPAMSQALIRTLYAGEFADPDMVFEAPARQLKRFVGIIESAGNCLLERRYPRFREIHPRGCPPVLRFYQRLLDEWVEPGRLSWKEAQNRGLRTAIEFLAQPVGLVEVKAGSTYVFSPDPHGNAFLGSLFSMLSPSAETPLESVIRGLKYGPFGAPQVMVEFVLMALAQGGLISFIRRGRRVAADMMRMTKIEEIEFVAPGEIIGAAEREILLAECPFLFPGGQGNDAFGVRQQRDTWQNLNRFKEKSDQMVEELAKGLQEASLYTVFDAFDTEGILQKLEALREILQETKVSYQPREGLERFIRSWKQSALQAEDLSVLKGLQGFLSSGLVDQVNFVAHYMRHPCIERAAREEEGIRSGREQVLAFLQDPMARVVPDNAARFNSTFGSFREMYAAHYQKAHDRYYADRKPALPRTAKRSLDVLRRLAAIEVLDRPEGLEAFLHNLDAPAVRPCNRNPVEELRHSAVCGCGFEPGQKKEKGPGGNPGPEIDRYLIAYLSVLQGRPVVEALKARAYALKDMHPETSARLDEICDFVCAPERTSPAAMLDQLDQQTIDEISRALSGNIRVQERNLADLMSRLSGRRLSPRKVEGILREWMGEGVETDTVLSMSGQAGSPTARPQPGVEAFWPLFHAGILGSRFASPSSWSAEQVRTAGAALDVVFPGERLERLFSGLDSEALFRFISEEPFHTAAAQRAWVVLAERLLKGAGQEALAGEADSLHVLDGEASGIRSRLRTLKEAGRCMALPVPERLRARLWFVRILFDTWATKELQSHARGAVIDLEKATQDWLAVLPGMGPLGLDDNPVVVVLDAVAPDVWMESSGVLRSPSSLQWFRIDGEPNTLWSMNRMFGFAPDRNPSEEMGLRGIPFHDFEGTEGRPLAEVISNSPLDKPLVMRFSFFDRAAHKDGGRRLCDMPQILANLLQRQVTPLLEESLRLRRRFVVTTDHGLSLETEKLVHGAGGVFERAVFRAEWRVA